MAEQSLPVFVLACVACGKTVSGDEDKCPRCGVSFDGKEFECPFCGQTVTASQRKCGSCGTEFEIFAEEVAEASSIPLDNGQAEQAAPHSAPQADPVTYECPACGRPVGEADSKCPHCGAMFTE